MQDSFNLIISELEKLTKISAENKNICLAAACIHAQGILLRSGSETGLPSTQQMNEIKNFLDGYNLLKSKKLK